VDSEPTASAGEVHRTRTGRPEVITLGAAPGSSDSMLSS